MPFVGIRRELTMIYENAAKLDLDAFTFRAGDHKAPRRGIRQTVGRDSDPSAVAKRPAQRKASAG